jgi:hypothetical protein
MDKNEIQPHDHWNQPRLVLVAGGSACPLDATARLPDATTHPVRRGSGIEWQGWCLPRLGGSA